MGSFFFGLGNGSVSARERARIKRAIKASGWGASFVEYSDPGCKCGHGCRHDCPASQRYWFSKRNEGAPFDTAGAAAVLDAVGPIKTK